MTAVAVVGFGIMGSGLAQLFAQNGYDIQAMDANPGALKRGMDRIAQRKFGLDGFVKSGKMTEAVSKDTIGRIRVSPDLEFCVKDGKIVIENVDEDLTLKKSVFRELDRLCNQRVILGSDTSYLGIAR